MTEIAEGPARHRSETMGGLAKGLAIIELFGLGASSLTVAEAARGSNTTRAAARRCLLTMVELGYLDHDGRNFSPRPRLRRLGGAGSLRESLEKSAQPVLTALRDRLDEPVSLAILDGRDALFIARAEAPRIIQTGVRIGARMPAYATAAGRILLGDLPDAQVRDYLARVEMRPRTPRSIVDPDRLFAEIIATRASGFATNDEELELGMRAIAVAVRAGGETIGAITLSTLTLRASLDEMEDRYRAILESAAADLARACRAIS